MSDIKRIYVGLPIHLAPRVKWVPREKRVNPLSFIPGGTDIVIEYINLDVLGYDWVKHPSAYIGQIIIKKNLKRVYARFYKNDEEYLTNPFDEIWKEGESISDLIEKLKHYDTTPIEEIEIDKIEYNIQLQKQIKGGKIYFNISLNSHYNFLIEKKFLISYFYNILPLKFFKEFIDLLDDKQFKFESKNTNVIQIDTIGPLNYTSKQNLVFDAIEDKVCLIQNLGTKHILEEVTYCQVNRVFVCYHEGKKIYNNGIIEYVIKDGEIELISKSPHY